MAIRWQRQPTEHTCGQTCIAMLLRVDVRLVVDHMGDRPTYAAELGHFLSAYGYETPTKLTRVGKLGDLPVVAICRVVWQHRPRFGHWLLLVNGAVYDPSTDDPDAWWVNGGMMTSYLPVNVPWLR